MWDLQINQDCQPVDEWSVIAQAIDAMDNNEYAYIALSGGVDQHLTIEVYGGNQGRVQVLLTDSKGIDIDFALIDRTQTASVRLLNGLYGHYFPETPPEYCVDKALAHQALKHFFDTQERDESLEWHGWPDME